MNISTRILSTMSAFALITTPVLAAPPERQAANLDTPGTSRTLTLPEPADHSPVISLGSAIDPATGKNVEGFAIIHYKKGFHHRPGHSGGPGGGASKCFSFLSRGARWQAVEPWVVNPANLGGLSPAFVSDNLTAGIIKWEDAADGTVGDGGSVDILGAGATTDATLVADTSAPDGQNEALFADVSNVGAIAVTIVWGIFGGPPSGRELVEWDQVYDDVDYDWSAAGEAGTMDFENIATHELGHSVGMGHPDDSCTEETMYRFAAVGETKKRSLEAGDIAGVNELY